MDYNDQFNSEHLLNIDRNMRVPSRISMTGDKGKGQPSSYFMRDDLDADEGGSYSMNIPQRILVGGSDSHVLVSRDAPLPSGVITEEVLDPSGATRTNWSQNTILVETPPSSMTLSKVHYPDVEESTIAKHFDDSFGPPSSQGRLFQRLERIQRRIDSLEQNEEARRKKEWIVVGSIGLYVLIKLFSAVFSRNS